MRKVRRGGFSAKAAEAIYSLTGAGMVLGIVAVLLFGGYVVHGFQSGGIAKLAEMSEADRQRILVNLRFACGAMGTSCLVVVISAVIRYYVEETLGYALSLIGALFFFAPPFVLSAPSNNSAYSNVAISIVGSQLQTIGLTTLAPGLLLLFRDIVSRIIRTLTQPRKATNMVWGRGEQRGISPWRKAYGRCWELPHCRQFIRNLCNAYGSGKSCWRIKSGCYCDERTILRAMQAKGEGLDAEKHPIVSSALYKQPALTPAEKRARCRNCAIYSHHQLQKYRVVSPLAFPAVALLVWIFTPNLYAMIQHLVNFTDKIMKYVAFAPEGVGGASDWTQYVSGAGAVNWLFIAWLSIMTISCTLHLIEYFVFKVQV